MMLLPGKSFHQPRKVPGGHLSQTPFLTRRLFTVTGTTFCRYRVPLTSVSVIGDVTALCISSWSFPPINRINDGVSCWQVPLLKTPWMNSCHG